jgi:hypothetical protein
MFALLSAGYMLGLMVTNPCFSEAENAPDKNATTIYKCYPPGHALPKDQTRVPAAALPPPVEPPKPAKKASRCGNKKAVWYIKNGKKRYRCR